MKRSQTKEVTNESLYQHDTDMKGIDHTRFKSLRVLDQTVTFLWAITYRLIVSQPMENVLCDSPFLL